MEPVFTARAVTAVFHVTDRLIAPEEPKNNESFLIVAPAEFNESIRPFVEWKHRTGIFTKVFTIEYISKNFGGKDLSEQIRNAIKYEYLNSGIRWVLLIGDNESVPTRYVYVPDNATEDPAFKANLTATDLYYACLEGTWDNDEDGIYGEFSLEVDEVGWMPEVYVGRFPVKSEDELDVVIQKIMEYQKNPSMNGWASTFLLLGAIFNYSFEDDWEKSIDGAYLSHYLETHYLPDYFKVLRLFESTPDYHNFNNLTTENIISFLNLESSLVNWIGH